MCEVWCGLILTVRMWTGKGVGVLRKYDCMFLETRVCKSKTVKKFKKEKICFEYNDVSSGSKRLYGSK